MFENIGKKMKNLAMVITWIGIICSILVGIVLVVINEGTMILGVLVAILGSFMSWLSSFILYGFGELVDKTTEIESILSGNFLPLSSYKDIKDEEEKEFASGEKEEGRCAMCNKYTIVAKAKIGNATSDYKLCESCCNSYKATIL